MNPQINLPLNAETPERDAPGFCVGTKVLTGLTEVRQLSYFPSLSSRPDTAARCAVSHRGPFCARSSEKQNSKDRNNDNTEPLETGGRKNSFSGHAGDPCQVARRAKKAADKNCIVFWTQFDQQEWNCLVRILGIQICAMGVPKV